MQATAAANADARIHIHAPDLGNILDGHSGQVRKQQARNMINIQPEMIATPKLPVALRPRISRKVGQIRITTSLLGRFWCRRMAR
jgi:hypothetical protein